MWRDLPIFQQVLDAQNAGAVGVLIADNICVDGDDADECLLIHTRCCVPGAKTPEQARCDYPSPISCALMRASSPCGDQLPKGEAICFLLLPPMR